MDTNGWHRMESETGTPSKQGNASRSALYLPGPKAEVSRAKLMNGNNLLTPRQAEEAINSRLIASPIESLPLMQCVGATLKEDIFAERDLPPFDRVCMDGIAVDSNAVARGLRRFVIQATQQAGSPALELERSENAIEVMTGAILPHATDCIIPVEQYEAA